MGKKRKDIQIFLVSIVINIIIIFLLPRIDVEEFINKKIKIGLVSLETNKTTVPLKKRKKIVNLKKDNSKNIEISKKISKQEKKEFKKNKKLSLDELSNSISKREVELLNTENIQDRKIDNRLKNKLLSKKNLNEVVKKERITKEITLKREDITLKKLEIENNKSVKGIILKDNSFENIKFKSMLKSTSAIGLPSGYKLGVEDGDIIAKWDENNQNPIYPESAQLKGLQGKVVLKININEFGRITSVFIEKGSGIPEINIAIEKIARTWKIYLSKNGLNIKGKVLLEYSFKLLGDSN